MTQMWVLRSCLEKQPTDLRQYTCYFGGRTLVSEGSSLCPRGAPGCKGWSFRLHRDHLANSILIHCFSRSAGHHLASVHDQIPISEVASKIIVLLHEQNRQIHLR